MTPSQAVQTGEEYYHKHLKENTQFDPNDMAIARKYFDHAANKGDKMAKYYLGVMYLNGEGVTQDAQKALSFLESAAEEGLSFAQATLGVVYGQGMGGVQQDSLRAFGLLEKAADQVHVLVVACLTYVSTPAQYIIYIILTIKYIYIYYQSHEVLYTYCM